ncbi:MAG: dTDP-4-amino-4,6-dideoxygalactose transaminase [Saprospiraceae bacterium]|nr:dTDP-4-amino-4,6-dideoxygalactose transaminase [Saprospiraceae bacterium]
MRFKLFVIVPLQLRHRSDKEMENILSVIQSGNLSGPGLWHRKCEQRFAEMLVNRKAILTHSCTAALEMCALLLDIQRGDEVIVPSYTFVSTANAFALRGATIRFADSMKDHPNIHMDSVLPLINERTRAIVPVHYGGMAVDLDPILELARQKNIILVEDAAHAIDSKYKGQALGTFGQMACFSFHDTKPIGCGEGGMLCINNSELIESALLIYEKGTNRQEFLAGRSKDYQWKSLGSSYCATELQAAVLMAQLEDSERIFKMRQNVWDRYMVNLQNNLKYACLPKLCQWGSYNTSVFYILFDTLKRREEVRNVLAKNEIQSAGHYLCLHRSPFMGPHNKDLCPNAESIEKRLLRLPIYSTLDLQMVDRICEVLLEITSV